MTLIALVVGLGVERFLTHLFHMRELRWFDGYVDWGLATLKGLRGPALFAGTGALVVAPALPVLALWLVFRDSLLHIPEFLFAIAVLIFSLGPRDLSEEVDEYAAAVERNDEPTTARLAKELLETEAPSMASERQRAVTSAIFVQANNRIFGVVLWFVLLGPVGAWLFRVSDLVRRRAAFEAARADHGEVSLPFMRIVSQMHGVLAWLPSRLLALGYALAGSFEDALQDWRGYYDNCSEHFFEVNEDVVACAGIGALGGVRERADSGGDVEAGAVRSAMSLINRTLLIWLTVIALLTLFAWVV